VTMLKVFDGSAMRDVTSRLKQWNGTQWSSRPLKYWDGTEWRGGAIPLFDDFNRPNSSDLGVTSAGERPWGVLSGSWSISSNRIVGPTSGYAAATVESYTSDVDIKLDVSAAGRDAIVFRATDANNYWMVARYRNTTTSSFQCCSSVTRFCTCTDNCGTFCSCGSCPSTPGNCFFCDGGFGSVCYVTSNQNCPDTCSTCTSTDTTNRVYLIRVENGSPSTVNFWSVASSFSQLRVEAESNLIRVYTSASASQNVTGQSFNRSATLHGVGRSNLGNQSGTAMDNFDLTPVIPLIMITF
jgi:hypothetical protein